jgi:tetraacyldisaccharide 4'-kinase
VINLEDYWYRKNVLSFVLLPVSWLFCLVALVRRKFYELRNSIWPRIPAPVIVVGNLTVGGTGKSPMVIWLAHLLKANGYKPGIISRGYGGKAKKWPRMVTGKSDPELVGDEPVMIAHRTGVPLAVGPKRNKAGRMLVKKFGCNVIVSDDGLQHYAMARDIEIAMIDSKRRFGNGFCLPAGPLRESPRRLKEVDFVVVTGRAGNGEFVMGLTGDTVVNLRDPSVTQSLGAFRHQKVNAIAGIGNPQRFFDMLSANGIEVVGHPFPDHHRYTLNDVRFDDEVPLIMTEKDAVKCREFAGSNHWYLPIAAVPDRAFAKQLITRLRRLKRG